MEQQSKRKKGGIRRRVVRFLLWERRLYRRGERKPAVVVPKAERNRVLYSTRNSLRHWDGHVTKTLVLKRFWSRGVAAKVTRYVKTLDALQRMKTRGITRHPCTFLKATCAKSFQSVCGSLSQVR